MKNTIITILILVSFTVYSQAHDFHKPADQLKKVTTEKKPEKQIYKIYCSTCHDRDPLIDLNAPKFRHLKDWQVRLKQSKSKIFKNVDEGFNAMPQRGGCFECSDELLQLTIEYMLPKSK